MASGAWFSVHSPPLSREGGDSPSREQEPPDGCWLVNLGLFPPQGGGMEGSVTASS